MDDLRLFGSTSNLVRFVLKDKTTNQGKKALTGATTGLIISTIADNESTATGHIQTIAALGTYVAPSASNCRFGEVDSINHPGLYEFQFADARYAVANSKRLMISVNDAEATILDTNYEIELVQFNPFDATRLGLIALPNAAPQAPGGLITSTAGGLDIDEMNVDVEAIQTSTAGLTFTTTNMVDAKLTASGLDNIPITDPGGVAGQTTFPKILIALYRRFFKKATLTTTQLKTYGDNGTTVNTTQALSDDGITQTEGAAT